MPSIVKEIDGRIQLVTAENNTALGQIDWIEDWICSRLDYVDGKIN